MITFSEACQDPHLFGPWFEGNTWGTWRVLDKALFGEPLDDTELATFRELTGLDQAPTVPAKEAWIIAGRRGGKDVKAGALGAYIATIGAEIYGLTDYLVPGERGVVQVLAVDRDQARVCFGYVRAYFEQPMLKRLVSKVTSDTIELNNRLAIEITTNDRRRVRGRTVIAAILDEIAFWHSEHSVNPDDEVYNAIRPAMATIPQAMLIGISSPYARRGLLWNKYRKHYGQPGSVLIVQAPTWVMNPTIPRDGEFLTEAFNGDPVAADAEYGANFRTDIEAFVSREVVEACISKGVFERPFRKGHTYRAFTDPSGGSSDSMTLAIAHQEDDKIILDVIREWRPPFNPEQVVSEIATVLQSYRISKVTGDRYGAEWVRSTFRKLGVEYRISERVRTDLYLNLLPVLNSGKAELLDNDKLLAQLVGLERRMSRTGRESIDHAPGSHDDVANAVAGAIDISALAKVAPKPMFGTYCTIANATPVSPPSDLLLPHWARHPKNEEVAQRVRDYINTRSQR